MVVTKKILFILNSNELGGATISFLNLILNLNRKEFTPIVVIPKQSTTTELEEILKKYNIECHRIFLVASVLKKFEIRYSLKWVIKYLFLPIIKMKSRKELNELVQRISPDIIHTNVGVIHEGFHVARSNNIPHVWHLREYQTKDFQWNIFPSYSRFCSYLRKSHVITITEDIRLYFGLQGQKNALTIYNGIFKENDSSNISQKEKYFLMASRISAEKGHADVIKAFAQFSQNKEYSLKIMGFGNEHYIEELKKLAEEYHCTDNIEFLGFQKDVKPIMTKAKALIVASYNEGFGRMTAESAFCGTIVIGKNTGGTKEILDKTGGLLFDNVTDMVDKMEIISKMQESEYNRIALKAQNVAKRYYSVESNVSKISNVYKSLFKR